MKSVEQLKKLNKNPYYTLTPEESLVLEQAEADSTIRVSSVTIDGKKKRLQTSLASAAVKETGKLNKHPSDPVTE